MGYPFQEDSAFIAPPILASSLLESSPPRLQSGQSIGGDQNWLGGKWDLRGDLDGGIVAGAAHSVLSCGRVVGISGLRPSHNGRRAEEDERQVGVWVGEVSVLLFRLHVPLYTNL
jgi:hypothetical protein